MISPRDEINKELRTFLKEITGIDNIYNTRYINTKPSGDRIEFMLDNFIANSQNYQTRNTSNDKLNVGSISEYRCQLKIRVIFEDSIQASIQINNIIGALRTREYVEQYINHLYIEGSSIRSRTVPFFKDGAISFIPELISDCYTTNEFNSDIDYFDKVESTEIKII